MKRTTNLLQAAMLILVAGLFLAGCGSPGEVRYINRANSTEVLTLNRARTVKTKLISTFHGVSNGTYTLKTEKGTFTGTYSSDSKGIKFRLEEGKSVTSKIKDDGSFDFADGTWQQAPVVMEKSLKALASSTGGAAQ